MSDLITTAHVQQYSQNIHMLAQQKGSKLRGFVREEMQVGKHGYFDRLGPTEVYQVTSRRQPTQFVDAQHSRRRVSMEDWQWAETVDQEDVIRILIDPKSSYVEMAVNSMGRRVDRTIIGALDGDVFEGETGATTTTFDTANQEVVAGGVNMTVAKLREALSILRNNDVDLEAAAPICVLHPNSWDSLYGEDEFINADFTKNMVLQGGKEANGPMFLGMRFIVTTLLDVDGSSIRDNFLYLPWAMGLKIGSEMKVRVTEESLLSGADVILVKSSFAATRIDDQAVVRILTDET
jgi:hypothetical protein